MNYFKLFFKIDVLELVILDIFILLKVEERNVIVLIYVIGFI